MSPQPVDTRAQDTQPVDTRRVDAREKVTGAALYATDLHPDQLAHATLATATIGRGRIAELDVSAAAAVPGVLLVLSHLDHLDLQSPGFVMGGGYGVQSLQPLLDDRIAYRGQAIALVVAETLTAATEAANLVRARYETEPFAATLDSPGVERIAQPTAIPLPFLADIDVGDAESAYAAAPLHVDATYDQPAQHQNPMELIGATVWWRGDTLVVHEGTQSAGAIRHGLAQQLGIDAANVEVVSPYTGGGFGQKNSLQIHIAPLAVAARRLGRPVQLVVSRAQLFHHTSFRPASRHRIRLGADEHGRMVAAIHEVEHQTSRHDLFPLMYNEITARLYGIRDFRGRQTFARMDTQTPGFMRAPFEHPAAFAFESAVDELAYAANRDPLEFRLANDTTVDPVSGEPFSSRHLAQCLRRGAKTFGWSARRQRPASMRAEDGSLVGWGVAVGAYPASIVPATSHVVAGADGRVRVEVDGHEMGQGIRSTIALLVADDLGIDVRHVDIVVGDTRVATQHLTAGSWGTASALGAVHAALRELRKQLGADVGGPVDVSAAVRAASRDTVEARAATLGPGQTEQDAERARQGHPVIAGPEFPGYSTFSWIAHFVEVRVEPTTCRIRVPRVVSVADCGRVASPVTAASQVRGGIVWGIGASLREAGEVDPRYGGFLNASLEEYPVPVNADIGTLDVDFIGEPDLRFHPVGVKGLGEVSMVGVAAAVANAVFHATGVRHRRLPIRIEDVLAGATA
ncbi:xanthine dehydrogenase family protein molybdopterin-binding subunit [Catellatospora chokoriensis]|uniref:Xanthine dehydrogenase n=1 Tax=Catellatospora chokoriensis TaxID=310353 RepID=A0A8J3NW10_9ACTN|nr:xanthine dehydrogenase family protein molybdopterin-binding subunit [Catellatospora chokoriensis]GIF92900.1 xanthine dehydrogenase [Catellatospora chokoriensis]